jgi:hypothetical protein
MYTGSLFVKLSPSLEVLKVVENSTENLLPSGVYNAYNKEEFEIKFVAVGVLSGSASFKVWPCK